MPEQNQFLEKIENLMVSADKFNEMSFRLVLEGLVNKGGEEAEFLMVRYVSSTELEMTTRINVIRVVGYIQSPHFLIPLKKIIDSENNIFLKKEAVISVSKYNNRQALNILNNALTKIKNSLLLQTINNEIAKIKKNNPIFGLLPRFLEGNKDRKNFRVTLDILKRILTPADAAMFINYLECGKASVENGAFEILCYTGDIRHQEPILKFFQDRFNQSDCVSRPECEDLYLLTNHVRHYFVKYPALIDTEIDNLGTQLLYIKDIRIRSLFVSILCQSKQENVIAFIGKRYDEDPEMRESIITEYTDNEMAVGLLFEKYKTSESTMKRLLIKALLTNQKGISFFYRNFNSLDPAEQNNIVNSLPYGGKQNLAGFFNAVFQTESVELKSTALKKIHDYYDYSARPILFDPERENDFSYVEQDYIDTIARVFPLQATRKLFEKIVFSDVPLSRAGKFFEKLGEVSAAGMAFVFKDEGFTSMLFNKVLKYNNGELSTAFLNVVKRIKTFDLKTYSNLNQGLNYYINSKEGKLGAKEEDEIRKIRANFKELYLDIKKTEESLTALVRLISREDMDIDKVFDFLNLNPRCVSLNIERLTQLMEKQFMSAQREGLRNWSRFFHKYPLIGYRLKDTILSKSQSLSGHESADLMKLHTSLPTKSVKIVIRLSSKQITTILRDQCMEILPGIPVDTGGENFEEGDMLICDSETLKDFILKNMLPSKKLFLFLENRAEFSSFKSYNPRPFLKPFSSYRIMKELLKEVYL
ncbi:MAG: hypothetical protein GY765_21905 [bacterium]|nr:hypothetical protein [bacterium]